MVEMLLQVLYSNWLPFMPAQLLLYVKLNFMKVFKEQAEVGKQGEQIS